MTQILTIYDERVFPVTIHDIATERSIFEVIKEAMQYHYGLVTDCDPEELEERYLYGEVVEYTAATPNMEFSGTVSTYFLNDGDALVIMKS